MLRPDSLAFTALLAFLISFGPLSVDLYLPSLPEIASTLAAPAAQVQLTISLYLIGYAIGQIVYGPISDRYGRKPVLIAAFAIYCAATIVCLVAPTIQVLIAGRIVQALGVSGGLVVARAVVRDLHEGVHAGRQLSLMSTMMGCMPIVAPLVGGALLTLYGWRAGFVFQFVCGALAGFLVWRCIAESHAPSPVSFTAMLQNYRTIGTNRVFLANLAIGSFAYSGLFAWIGGSPFVMQTLQGLSPLNYALLYALSTTGFMIGGAIATRVVLRLGLDRTAGLGALVLTLAGAGMIASTVIGTSLPVTMTVSMGLYLCGMGMLFSQVVAAALSPFPRAAGTASSLIGFAQQCAGAAMATLVGAALGTTPWPMTIGVAAAGGGALLLWIVTRRVRLAAA